MVLFHIRQQEPDSALTLDWPAGRLVTQNAAITQRARAAMMALRFGGAALLGGGRRCLLDQAKFPAAVVVASSSRRDGFSALPPNGRDDAARADKKAKIHAAWDSSAEGYVSHIQDGGAGVGSPSSSSPFSSPAAVPPAGATAPAAVSVAEHASVGYKLAARIVVNLSNKRCEGASMGGKEVCKERATHGDPAEGATACELHKADGMVQLREPGAPVVLDVASAGGEPAITIAKALPGATVHATDFAPAMVDQIRRRASAAGLSNVTAALADGEALTGFEDGSVDAVTCTWGLMFMPEWQHAVKEFSRVLRRDGVVAVTLWEGHEDSIFHRIREVTETLVPGFKGLIDPEALGWDGGAAVMEEMKAAGLHNISLSKFSVPVALSPGGRPGDIWEYYARSTPLGRTLSSLEAKGRKNVRREARAIFESRMERDWAEGRAPLGLPEWPLECYSGSGSGTVTPASVTPLAFYARAFVIAGRKCGG